MKKVLTAILLCLSSFLAASAETLFVENFQYPIGNSITNESSAWFLPWGGFSVYSITNGLTFSGYAESGVGNAVVIDQKVSNDQPHHAFTEQTSGSLFVAFMFQPSIVSKAGYFFALRDNQVAGNTVFNFNGRILINDSYQLGLTFADNQKAVYSSVFLDPQKVHLLVLRYDIVEGTNNDQVSLYVFSDACPSAEPTAPLIGPLSDASKVDINPAHVVLRGYDNDGWLVIDGIRVATTFEEAAALAEGAALETVYPNQPALILRNGQLMILRTGRYFSLSGQLME